VPVASERRRRWFVPRPLRGIEAQGLAFVGDIVDWLEARLLWARFGL
jgi:hypothetical protein